jgi:hypothetical protein
MNAPMVLLFVIGLLALAFVGAAAVVGFLVWRDDLRFRYAQDHVEGRGNVDVGVPEAIRTRPTSEGVNDVATVRPRHRDRLPAAPDPDRLRAPTGDPRH